VEQAGMYSCVAGNTIGYTSGTAWLTVLTGLYS
jgi:hypothetical protein